MRMKRIATRLVLAALAALALLACAALPAHAQRNEARDRAEIHALLMAYGATLDSRDFDGFGKLFGEDGVYVGGGGREAKGAAAGEMMRQVFANNPNGVGEPNFHLFYNEVVTFDGPDRARATSMSLWMVPDQATKAPDAAACRPLRGRARPQERQVALRPPRRQIRRQPPGRGQIGPRSP
jgi:uncharacterized protein (TIGR02246 family)